MRRKLDLNYTYYLMFSDEALFINTGQVNKHNMHCWSDINLR